MVLRVSSPLKLRKTSHRCLEAPGAVEMEMAPLSISVAAHLDVCRDQELFVFCVSVDRVFERYEIAIQTHPLLF